RPKGKDMRLKIKEILGRLVLVTACVAVASIASYGQSLPGNMEVTGNLGLVGGMGGGSHGSFGGSVGAPISDRLILSGDLSYIPLGGGSVTMLGATTRTGARAINFNGNLQYQFNAYRAVVPYAGAGLGFLRTSFNASSSGLGPSFNAQGS